jgi:serpin B
MYCVLSGDISGDYEKYINNMEYKKVNVTLPKFKTEFSTEASDVLKTLGINAAFDQNSQTPHFAPMFNDTVNNQTNVYIDKAIQKVYIDVNEEGTEAAAVTAITMNAMSALEKPEKVYEFKADKPFTYFIRDNSTGEILFMGEYAYTE